MLTVAYLRERFDARIYVPLALFIAGAAAGGTFSAARLGVDATFALLLLAQFRAWDDLADRHRDRRTHPERVLVRTESTAPIALFVAAVATLNIAFVLQRDATGVAPAVLLALIVTLGIWYARRDRDPATRTRTAAGDQLLLAKYAAMVLIVAGGDRLVRAPAPIFSAALALHLGACVYEAWHDPGSPLR
jgi:4-hydroxybenzoate polyprenyltransferase